MDLLPTPEQDEIISSVRSFLGSELPITRVRELQSSDGAAGVVGDDLWRRCAALGWFGLGLDEQRGGVGYGLTEESLMFRELGRHLTPGPFLATVLAARLAPDPTRAAILDGSARVALVEVHGGSVGAAGVTGEAHVYDRAGAQLGLAVTPDGAALIDLAALSDLESVPGLDCTTSVATARAVAVAPVAYVGAGDDPVFQRGSVLVAAMASGIAEATRDLSADYAKSRVQFGKPIGVNQAIKHACTDMAVRAEASTMQTFFAAMSVDSHRGDAAFQVASAKVMATTSALQNARATIQTHGGIGFTWEHDSHLFLNRAHVLDHLLGSRRQHLAALLAMPAAQ